MREIAEVCCRHARCSGPVIMTNTIETISLVDLNTVSGGVVRSGGSSATTQLMLQQMQTQLTASQANQNNSSSNMMLPMMAMAMASRRAW